MQEKKNKLPSVFADFLDRNYSVEKYLSKAKYSFTLLQNDVR